jgi:hypothetical protein
VERLIEKYELNTVKEGLSELKEVKLQINDLRQAVEFNQDQITLAVQQTTQVKSETKALNEKIKTLEKALTKEREERIAIDCSLRSHNLKFLGIKEEEHASTLNPINRKKEWREEEDCKEKVAKVLASNLKVDNAEIDCAYRLGNAEKSKKFGGTRPIFVKFVKKADRDRVWANRSKLKGTSIIIKEDLPIEVERNMRRLGPIFHKAKEQNLKATLNRDILRINGEKFTVSTLKNLPESLQPEKLSTRTLPNMVLFWSRDSVLSNHNTNYPFFVDGEEFASNEQFYCAQKAVFFNDISAKNKIMQLKDPVEQKKMPIKGYNENEWNLVAETYMKKGLMAKFSQSEELKNYLLSTGEKTLGEASPYDSKWGIGLRINSTEIMERNNWGQNRLGALLMEIRNEIR